MDSKKEVADLNAMRGIPILNISRVGRIGTNKGHSGSNVPMTSIRNDVNLKRKLVRASKSMTAADHPHNYVDKIKQKVKQPSITGAAKATNLLSSYIQTSFTYLWNTENLFIGTKADFMEGCVEERGFDICIISSKIMQSRHNDCICSVDANVVVDAKDMPQVLEANSWQEGIFVCQKRQLKLQ